MPLWVAMGANLLQVSRWLGHSSVQITAGVYGHLFPDSNDLVIGRLDRALRDALPHPAEQPTTGDAGLRPTVPARSPARRHRQW